MNWTREGAPQTFLAVYRKSQLAKYAANVILSLQDWGPAVESPKNLSFNNDYNCLLLQVVTDRRLEKIKKLRDQGIPLNQIALIQAQGYPIFTETNDGLQVEDCFYARRAKPEDRNFALPLLNGVLMRWEMRNPNKKMLPDCDPTRGITRK